MQSCLRLYLSVFLIDSSGCLHHSVCASSSSCSLGGAAAERDCPCQPVCLLGRRLISLRFPLSVGVSVNGLFLCLVLFCLSMSMLFSEAVLGI